MIAQSTTTDALQILHHRYYVNNPKRLSDLEAARTDDAIARQLLALREAAGLSQRELAQLVGTTASVICRLEDANYHGHSLKMLNRIATTLNYRLVLLFEPL
jgi:ribosome-binding protein aMBF1 (putative translation factor)